jgi:hypothetical protein
VLLRGHPQPREGPHLAALHLITAGPLPPDAFTEAACVQNDNANQFPGWSLKYGFGYESIRLPHYLIADMKLLLSIGRHLRLRRAMVVREGSTYRFSFLFLLKLAMLYS